MSVAQLPDDWLPEIVPRQEGDEWLDLLLRGKPGRKGEKGPVLSNLANAMIAIRLSPQWKGVLAFDEFHLRLVAQAATPWGYTGAWSDHQTTLAAEWFQHRSIGVGLEVAGQAVHAVAREVITHPVRSWLESITWDGVHRLAQWTSIYLGSNNTPYTRAIGERFMRSAVARIMRPGCKVDTAPILESEQGKLKSSAVATLGGKWYTDALSDFGSKDAALELAGAWFVELSELDALRAAEASRVKAFMSRRVDRFRPPYGRQVLEVPRQCVFIGTTNHDTYLRDETGGRRFWPLRCGDIRLPDLERDREQLFAEAVVEFKAGLPWWLDSNELVIDAEVEQKARHDSDPWQQLIETWIAGRDPISIDEILEGCLEKPKGQWLQTDKTRIGRCLRVADWQRFQKRVGDADGRQWLWKPRAARNNGKVELESLAHVSHESENDV